VQRKRVEHAAFAHMAARLAAHGHRRFVVRFRATERNGASARLLEELGFVRDGAVWIRPLDRAFPDSDVVAVAGPARAEAA
jgi:RimJ/RimL family protein N-acetyltransferase